MPSGHSGGAVDVGSLVEPASLSSRVDGESVLDADVMVELSEVVGDTDDEVGALLELVTSPLVATVPGETVTSLVVSTGFAPASVPAGADDVGLMLDSAESVSDSSSSSGAVVGFDSTLSDTS